MSSCFASAIDHTLQKRAPQTSAGVRTRETSAKRRRRMKKQASKPQPPAVFYAEVVGERQALDHAKKLKPSLHFVHHRLPRGMSECQLSTSTQGVGHPSIRRNQINRCHLRFFQIRQDNLLTIDAGVQHVSLENPNKSGGRREASPAG